MSRPVHLNRKGSWGACGKQSDLQAHDYRHVTCLSCRKTHFWKTCQSFDRVAKVSKLGEYAASSPKRCVINNNARWCATEKRWRIPGDRCLACSDSRHNSVGGVFGLGVTAKT